MSNYVLVLEGKKWHTSKMEQLVDEQSYEGGVKLVGVWKTHSGRILVVTDSIWASSRNDGTVVGIQAHFAEPDEIAELADEYRGELLDMVPEGE